MKSRTARRYIIVAFCIAVLATAMFALLAGQKKKEIITPAVETPESTVAPAAPEVTKVPEPQLKVLGSSVEGRPIESYTFGNGEAKVVFIGGIHGGYEWNSVLLAYGLIDYLTQNPESLPENLTVTVIPSMNPDGVYKVIGKEGRFEAADVPAGTNGDGRLNADGVDLNRNFGCNWKAQAIWRQNPVSGGTAAFSEPESAAIRNYILENEPAAVIFYHSQSNAIYGSQCGGDMLAETSGIMNAYSAASGYRTVTTFDGYEVTGDATDWMASIGIPAMTVELATHETIEWAKNLAGIQAIFEYYENKK